MQDTGVSVDEFKTRLSDRRGGWLLPVAGRPTLRSWGSVRGRIAWCRVGEQTQTFEPFAREGAYIRVNEKLVGRMLRRLPRRARYQVLDIAAGTGLMTRLAHSHARAIGAQVESVILDADLSALMQARRELLPHAVRGFVCASADRLPFDEAFDMAIFANSLHLLGDQAKQDSLAEVRRVLRPGGVLAVNSAFYKGAAPEDSQPFYGRWIRRAVVEINQARPRRMKSDRALSMQMLALSDYRDLVACGGFRVVEVRERRVLLSQAAVRAISGYRDFAMGALRASEEDADDASRALRTTVQQAFRDLKMRYLPRNWLEIIAVKP
jgi:ubiquinone/menaquinone biosynthesis C-methylase UbiE